jgi:endogenous inhibitor of DNA gyrase (YacG/DUF329 family)
MAVWTMYPVYSLQPRDQPRGYRLARAHGGYPALCSEVRAMTAKTGKIRCPQCGGEASWSPQNPYRPFCSERCKLIDLGAWAAESYRLPVQEEADEPRSASPEQ